MIYFRVALRMDQSTLWRWKSCMLTTPGTLFDFLNMYDRFPKNRLRVFFATSTEFMSAMLDRENRGLSSNSVTVEQFLQSRRRIDAQGIRWLESELALELNKELIARSVITRKLGDESYSLQANSSFEPANQDTSAANGNIRESNLMGKMQEASEWSIGGDHDAPYTFALPVSTPQALAWARLLAKVQRGELEP